LNTNNPAELFIKAAHITFIYSLLGFASAYGQFMTIEIDVAPEVETSVNQSLDFGQIVAGAGLQEVPLGSPSMGIFQIRALNAQSLIISIEPVTELVHEELGQMASIPIRLQASYTQNGTDDYRQSTPLEGFLEYVTLEPPPQNPGSAWSSIYLYVYGSIDLGIVPAGVYTGEIVLTVIYE
jgi:hypothetical protein